MVKALCELPGCDRVTHLIAIDTPERRYRACQTHYKRFRVHGVVGGPIDNRRVSGHKSNLTTESDYSESRNDTRGRVTTLSSGNRLTGTDKAKLNLGVGKSASQSETVPSDAPESEPATESEISETELRDTYGALVSEFISAVHADASYSADIVSVARRMVNRRARSKKHQKS